MQMFQVTETMSHKAHFLLPAGGAMTTRKWHMLYIPKPGPPAGPHWTTYTEVTAFYFMAKNHISTDVQVLQLIWPNLSWIWSTLLELTQDSWLVRGTMIITEYWHGDVCWAGLHPKCEVWEEGHKNCTENFKWQIWYTCLTNLFYVGESNLGGCSLGFSSELFCHTYDQNQ